MYLHIGNGESIKESDIVGIFDLDTATVSSITKNFITKKEKEKKIRYTDEDLPRSFILLGPRDDLAQVKLSRISTFGLQSRAEGDLAGE